jgi:phage gp36-like protein
MPYATGSDLITRYDVRIIGDLVEDDNTRDGSPSAAAEVTELLATASSMIDSALLTSGRYSASELAELEAAGDRMLKDMACRITMSLLWERRGVGVPSQFQASIDRSFDMLDQLRKGSLVPPSDASVLASKVDAGVPDAERQTFGERLRVDGVVANMRTFPIPGTRKA